MVSALRRQVVLFCALLTAFQRSLCQDSYIGNLLPCEGIIPDPTDNLNCVRPLLSPFVCFEFERLCDGTSDCVGVNNPGLDEGIDVASLDCGMLIL